MPIFDKLLHSSIRNKLSQKIYKDLQQNSIEAKNTEYTNYIPIKYESSEKINYICSIKDGIVYSDWGFIFTKNGKFIKDNLSDHIFHHIGFFQVNFYFIN